MRVAWLLSLVCASVTSLAGDPPLKVTVQQLVATPEKFVGKRVEVTGWYSVYVEDSQLYASSRAMSSGSIDDSIWSLEAMSAPFPSRNSRVGPGPVCQVSCRKALFVVRGADDDLS